MASSRRSSVQPRSSTSQFSSHTVFTATAKDYERMKMAQKHENKLELEYGNLERKLISKSKWNDRAARQSLCIKPTTSTNGGADVSSIDNWLQHEREKAQKIIQSKQSANEHIRRFSVSPNAKPTGGSRRKASTTQPMTYVRKISTTT